MASFLSFLFGWFGKSTEVTLTNETTTETTTRGAGDSKKRSLHIGINRYKTQSNRLQGCVNDAREHAKLLKNKYGFGESVLILDQQASYKNIIRNIKEFIESASYGDTLVLTYSGHGSNVIDYDGDEKDGKDETWVSADEKHITDDTLREIISKLPEGVKLTVVADSCHSQSMTRGFLETMSDNSFYSKPRYLPPEDEIDATALASLPSKRALLQISNRIIVQIILFWNLFFIQNHFNGFV